MPKGHPIWNSFAAGEISPRMLSRSDMRGWRNGVRTMRNMVSTSHGPAMRRGGFWYLGRAPATDARMIGYSPRREVGFQICITDAGQIYFFDLNVFADMPNQIINGAPWTGEEIRHIYYDIPPGNKEIYLVSHNVAPQKLVYDETQAIGFQWTLEAVPFTFIPEQDPDNPGEKAWRANNYPSAIAFFEGRLWLAATDSDPERMWASQSGDYLDFTPGAEDDDGLDFTISRQGKIEWLAAAQTLVIGTANGEHVAGSDAGVITPSDIEVTQQSSYGSRDTQAVLIGNIVLYVSPDGRKLRDVGYRWEENNWLSRDITFLSEHITKDNEIREVAWSQHPDNFLWAATDQGDLLGCTYERNYDVIGWHHHRTNGFVKSVSSVDVNGQSLMAMAVARGNDGYIYFERYEPGIQMDAADNFVDYTGSSITVPHLANFEVTLTIDEAVHPNIVLDENGTGQLQYEANGQYIEVGLPYNSYLLTLPLDFTPEEQGTSQHWMKRFNKIFVRLLDSTKPEINGIRPPTRHPSTPMNTREPAATEDVYITDRGWDRQQGIEIRQDLPIPLTVLAVYGEVAQETL